MSSDSFDGTRPSDRDPTAHASSHDALGHAAETANGTPSHGTTEHLPEEDPTTRIAAPRTSDAYPSAGLGASAASPPPAPDASAPASSAPAYGTSAQQVPDTPPQPGYVPPTGPQPGYVPPTGPQPGYVPPAAPSYDPAGAQQPYPQAAPAQPMPGGAYPGPGQPGYVPQAAPGQLPMNPQEELQWAMLTHVGSLFLGFLAPLIVMLTMGERSRFVKFHAVQSLNLQIVLLIAYVITGIIALVTCGFGIILVFVPMIAHYVFEIIGAVKANKGEWYRMPVPEMIKS